MYESNVSLYCVGGSHAGEIFILGKDSILIGRDTKKCAILYADQEPGVSGIHCQLRVVEDCMVELMDLGSSYGTFLKNGIRVQKNIPNLLNNGDGFYLGNKNNQFLVKVKSDSAHK